MPDPIVHITNGIPDSGTGNITTLGQTLTDGANVALGATTDAAVTAGAAGTVNAHLRSISRDIAGGVVLQPGTNVIGHVVVDSGTIVVTQPTGTNLHVVVDSGTISTTGSNSFTHISTATTTNGIKSGAGTLVAIVINQAGTSSTATIFDNTTATGTTIGVLDCSSRIGDIQYNAAFSTGLSIITTGSPAPDLTIIWR